MINRRSVFTRLLGAAVGAKAAIDTTAEGVPSMQPVAWDIDPVENPYDAALDQLRQRVGIHREYLSQLREPVTFRGEVYPQYKSWSATYRRHQQIKDMHGLRDNFRRRVWDLSPEDLIEQAAKLGLKL